MTLSSHTAGRRRIHTRAVHYESFERDDGLWDIEGYMRDSKAHPWQAERGWLPPGDALHDMWIRATVDKLFVIQAIEVSMHATPYMECGAAEDPMQAMVGVTMGPGWRREIESRLGGIKGCTHMRELLFNMATVAYQTAAQQKATYEEQAIHTASLKKVPFHLSKCVSWALDSPVVKRHYPQFYAGPGSSAAGQTDTPAEPQADTGATRDE